MLEDVIGSPLSPRQHRSIADSVARVNLWEGSVRSGKTISSLLRFLIFLGSPPKGGALIVVGRTRDSAWRNVLGPLQDPAITGEIAPHVIGNHGAPTANILGRRVYVMGASDVKAELVLRGLTVAGAYVDEVTTIPEGFFTQLLGRMSVPGAQLFATTNPDNPAHWLKRRFLDRLGELPDWRSWHFTLDDNPGLTEAFKDSLKREFTGLWFRRFVLGEWVAAEGAIYDMWDPERHVIPWGSIPPIQRLLSVGVDYGTTNPTAGLMLGITAEAKPSLILLDEWRHDPAHEQRKMTDAELSAGLRGWLPERHIPGQGLQPRLEWVAVDPSAASLKVQLSQDGLANVIDADNDVPYGIRTVASLLSTGQLKVTDRCQGFIREAPGYSWDDKATEQGKDVPKKVADHSLDGGRYAVTTTETIWRALLPQAA